MTSTSVSHAWWHMGGFLCIWLLYIYYTSYWWLLGRRISLLAPKRGPRSPGSRGLGSNIRSPAPSSSTLSARLPHVEQQRELSRVPLRGSSLSRVRGGAPFLSIAVALVVAVIVLRPERGGPPRARARARAMGGPGSLHLLPLLLLLHTGVWCQAGHASRRRIEAHRPSASTCACACGCPVPCARVGAGRRWRWRERKRERERE
jgi:hypothetical protein